MSLLANAWLTVYGYVGVNAGTVERRFYHFSEEQPKPEDSDAISSPLFFVLSTSNFIWMLQTLPSAKYFPPCGSPSLSLLLLLH